MRGVRLIKEKTVEIDDETTDEEWTRIRIYESLVPSGFKIIGYVDVYNDGYMSCKNKSGFFTTERWK